MPTEARTGGIRHNESWTQTSDGLTLFWQRWLPAGPRAVLVFVHGLFEHSGRYLNPARYFAPRGFACYAFDHRGHGRSPGTKVHVDRFDEFLIDVRAHVALAREQHPELPLVLVGHSHGGLVVLLHALRHPEGLPGVVVSSPLLALHPASRPPRPLAALAGLLSRLLPRVRCASRLDPTWLSHDRLVGEAYASDPLVGRRASARWFTELATAVREVEAGAAAFPVPALVMAAGEDHVVDAEATRRWAGRAPREKVELVVWDGFYHELFNELEKERVFRRMEDWLAVRVRPARA